LTREIGLFSMTRAFFELRWVLRGPVRGFGIPVAGRPCSAGAGGRCWEVAGAGSRAMLLEAFAVDRVAYAPGAGFLGGGRWI